MKILKSKREICDALGGVSWKTVLEWQKTKGLPVKFMRRQWFSTDQDLAQWMSNQVQGKYDADYEAKRNALIPEAEKYADKTCGERPARDIAGWRDRWNRAFLDEMDRLVIEAGIVKAFPASPKN